MKNKTLLIILLFVLVFPVVSGNLIYNTQNISKNYSTIQEAINNASEGNTIIVGNGTYDEQVVINKSLTLQGVGDTTIIKPSSAAKLTTILTGKYWDGSDKQVAGVVVANVSTGSNVNIKNLKIDGSDITTKPVSSDYFAEIFYRETGGTINNVSIYGGGKWSDWDRGYGIYLSAATNSVYVEIKNSVITNYDKNGIEIMGDKLIADINHNTIIGRGPLPNDDEVQNGINVGRSATAIVNYNIISNLVWTALDWWSTGILFVDGSGSANKNTINNVQSGIIFQDSNGTAENNIISGGTNGLTGIWAQYTKSGSWIVSFVNNTVDKSDDSMGYPLPTLYQNAAIGTQSWNAGASITVNIKDNHLLSSTSTTADGIYIGDIPANSPAGNIETTIVNNNISNWQHGIHLVSSISYANISNNRIKNNIGTSSGIHIEQEVNASNVDINYNDIISNTNYGIFNENANLLNAAYNWWGHCSGPNHPTTNPSGLGNSVSDNVDYTPWLKRICIGGKTTAPTCILEDENVTLYANVTSDVCIGDVIFSVNANGTWINHTGNYLVSNYSYKLSSNLITNSVVYWTVYAEDCYNHTAKDGEENFNIYPHTILGITPSNPDGQNGWYISNPTFSLTNPNDLYIFCKWDAQPIWVCSGSSFGFEDAPNNQIVNGGTIDLNYWGNISCGRNESMQTKIIKSDLIAPEITNLIPINNSITYDLTPEISALLRDRINADSGINILSLVFKLDGQIKTNLTTITNLSDFDYEIKHIPSLNLSYGVHNVSVYIEDYAGRSSEIEWRFEVKEIEKFNMNVYSPQNKIYGSTKIPFNITTDKKVSLIEYIDWNDGERWTRLCINCNSYGNSSNKSRTFKDGEHNLTIRARNSEGFVREENILFFIDSKTPKIYSTLPKINSFTDGSEFYVKFSEENTESVFLIINKTIPYEVEDCSITGKYTECYLNLGGQLDAFEGNETEYYFNVSDSVRSISSRTVKIKVDSLAPELEIISPINGGTYVRRVLFEIEVDESNFASLSYVYDYNGREREVLLCTKLTNGVCKVTKSFVPGDYEITLKAEDKAGNVIGIPMDFEVK